MNRDQQDRVAGVLLGTAIGDALGLPAEGLRPATIRKLDWAGNWRHRFVGKHGMWSDDTEHTILLSQALLASSGNASQFSRAFASELRWWLLGLPAGVGLATARAIIRLCLGFPPQRSGVFSAGNGPFMRTAVIGACYPADSDQRRELTEIHTRMTHSDPKALIAAQAVTELAALLAYSRETPSHGTILQTVQSNMDSDSGWQEILDDLNAAWEAEESVETFLRRLGVDAKRGISGYAWHTVPAVIFAGQKHGWRFRETLIELLDAGGDTDSVAAIAGALCGAFGGTRSLPLEWLSGIVEWPTNVSGLRRLAEALDENRPIRIRPRWSLPLLLRNLFFLLVALGHGISRPFFRCFPHRRQT